MEELDPKGKLRKRYPQDQIMTPFDKLKSLPDAGTHLKPGLTLAALEHTAAQTSENQAAQQLDTARTQLFQSIFRRSKSAA
ncbi:MAG: hypothetical protein ACRETN_09160 [Nevskiales bacterium]